MDARQSGKGDDEESSEFFLIFSKTLVIRGRDMDGICTMCIDDSVFHLLFVYVIT